MITLLKFRYYLKLLLIWFKSHWKQVLAVLAFLFISISSRNKNMSLSRVLEGTKKLHDDEVNALQSSYESQIESILNTEKQLKETLVSVEKKYAELSETMNAMSPEVISMEREVIADKAVWTAKKRYILNVWDSEGVRYKTPQLKMMGIESVKSSTPAPCREKLKQALKIIMDGDEKMLNSFIQEFRDEFMNLPPENIAYPRSVNGLKKFSSSSSLFLSLIHI